MNPKRLFVQNPIRLKFRAARRRLSTMSGFRKRRLWFRCDLLIMARVSRMLAGQGVRVFFASFSAREVVGYFRMNARMAAASLLFFNSCKSRAAAAFSFSSLCNSLIRFLASSANGASGKQATIFDVAKLNVGGWNLTLGTTAGFLETSGHITGSSGVAYKGAFAQSPFVGMCAAATYGRFLIEGVVQYDSFETTLDSPNALIFGQNLDACAFTMAASAGYNYGIPNSRWFVEPSAGFVWSREAVDPLNTVNPQPGHPIQDTTRFDAIESVIGRLGVRVGTTVESDKVVYAPFAAVIVWHDFAGDQTATANTCPNCMFPFTGVPGTSTDKHNNIGTFGQYSIGVSGEIKDTGWLGYARVDCRDGSEMHGLSGTGGIRYQFSPTAAVSAMPVNAKAPVDRPVDWTGWNAGLIGGATGLGGTSFKFPGVSTTDIRPSSWLGGGTLGYNFQKGKWVFGVEGDIAKTNTNGSAQSLAQDANQFLLRLSQATCHDGLDWIATATARLGYAGTPRSFVYVKAGGAFADEEGSMTCNLGSDNATPGFGRCNNPRGATLNQASTSTTRVGGTVGTEFALTDHWSIKGGFDRLDFGTKSLTLSDGTAVNSTLNIAQGKIGVNYRFWP